MPSLVWFRRDLRVHDNPALHHACRASSDGVVGLFIATPSFWQRHDDAPLKVAFWWQNLHSLKRQLESIHVPLHVVTCEDEARIPGTVTQLCETIGADQVFLNREYEVDELRRDEAVALACRERKWGFHRFHDRVIVPPHEVKTKQGNFYSVFTPYRRAWEQRLDEMGSLLPPPPKQPRRQLPPPEIPAPPTGANLTDEKLAAFPAGEAEAGNRLRHFTSKLKHYHQQRDLAAIDGTSRLSPYLAAGVLSPRQCLAAARECGVEHEGVQTWIGELAWRDFYTHVLAGFPRVSMHLPFRLRTQAIDWRANSSDLEAWKTGQTGYPLVDAGMRQLNATGWMHNRLRMVTAMFLTKHLLIDWRLGEQYFMQQLIDGDLAANNGGWQWSASTGTDSVPYFRIFNPFSQSKRFDARGEFIHRWVPELRSIPAAELHDEKRLQRALARQSTGYPDYVVDYKVGRTRALEAFKELQESKA